MASTVRPQPASTSSPPSRPPRLPFWGCLPPLTIDDAPSPPPTSSGARNNKDTDVPPIRLPDRVGSTRILLLDTQACVQKFSSRMDTLGSRIEQSLKEMQLARSAFDTVCDKSVLDITDTIQKSQNTISSQLSKYFDVHTPAIERVAERLSHLSSLYETHSSAITALSQTVHEQSTSLSALQSQVACATSNQHSSLSALQAQDTKFATTLASMEAEIHTIPALIEASYSQIISKIDERVERAVEGVIGRMIINGRVMPATAGNGIGEAQKDVSEKRKEQNDQAASVVYEGGNPTERCNRADEVLTSNRLGDGVLDISRTRSITFQSSCNLENDVQGTAANACVTRMRSKLSNVTDEKRITPEIRGVQQSASLSPLISPFRARTLRSIASMNSNSNVTDKTAVPWVPRPILPCSRSKDAASTTGEGRVRDKRRRVMNNENAEKDVGAGVDNQRVDFGDTDKRTQNDVEIDGDKAEDALANIEVTVPTADPMPHVIERGKDQIKKPLKSRKASKKKNPAKTKGKRSKKGVNTDLNCPVSAGREPIMEKCSGDSSLMIKPMETSGLPISRGAVDCMLEMGTQGEGLAKGNCTEVRIEDANYVNYENAEVICKKPMYWSTGNDISPLSSLGSSESLTEALEYLKGDLDYMQTGNQETCFRRNTDAASESALALPVPSGVNTLDTSEILGDKLELDGDPNKSTAGGMKRKRILVFEDDFGGEL